MTPSAIVPSKAPKPATPADVLKSAKMPLAEGETFTITLPRNFCEITAPTIFPVVEKLAFSAPQRLASLPLSTVASEVLALQIHVSGGIYKCTY